MICNNCGKENIESSKFCKFCGASFNQSSSMKKENNSAIIIAGIATFIVIVVIIVVSLIFFKKPDNNGNNEPIRDLRASENTLNSANIDSKNEAQLSDSSNIINKDNNANSANSIDNTNQPAVSQNKNSSDYEHQENNSSENKPLENKPSYNVQNYNFNSASASSYLGNQGSHTYYPSNAIDGDTKTAWVEGVDGNGENEWIEIRSTNLETIHKIGICNGYRENTKVYNENGKVRTALLEFSDGTSATISFNLSDSDEFTYFDVGEINTYSVRITLLSCESGSKYDDICISEIRVY